MHVYVKRKCTHKGCLVETLVFVLTFNIAKKKKKRKKMKNENETERKLTTVRG